MVMTRGLTVYLKLNDVTTNKYLFTNYVRLSDFNLWFKFFVRYSMKNLKLKNG